MANFTVTQSTLDFIAFEENRALFNAQSFTAYWDVSRWSIAFGSGRLLNGRTVQKGDVIGRSEAFALLKRDTAEAAGYVNKYVTSDINANMFSALVSLVFNAGIGRFLSSDLYKQVNQNPQNFTAIRSAFLASEFTTYNRTDRRIREFNRYADGRIISDSTPFFFIALLLILIFNWKRIKRLIRKR